MQNYVIRTGEPWGLPLEYEILPSYLKEKNYKSHYLGKWHIGMMNSSYTPISRKFDTFSGYFNGFVDYYTKEHTKVCTALVGRAPIREPLRGPLQAS